MACIELIDYKQELYNAQKYIRKAIEFKNKGKLDTSSTNILNAIFRDVIKLNEYAYVPINNNSSVYREIEITVEPDTCEYAIPVKEGYCIHPLVNIHGCKFGVDGESHVLEFMPKRELTSFTNNGMFSFKLSVPYNPTLCIVSGYIHFINQTITFTGLPDTVKSITIGIYTDVGGI